MAPRSSMIASAVRNTLSVTGTREPRIASTPSENAMSVAAGIAQPRSVSGDDALSATYTSAGATMPPTAAMPGKIRCCQLARCPSSSSRLISRPTSNEEQRHQRVVDPMQHAQAEHVARERRAVELGRRGVGHDQRNRRAGDQHQAAARLVGEQVAERGGGRMVRKCAMSAGLSAKASKIQPRAADAAPADNLLANF